MEMENLENSVRLLDENTKSLNKKAKFLVEHEFPKKILKLDKVLEQFDNKSLPVLEGPHQEKGIDNNDPGSGPRKQDQPAKEPPSMNAERAVREVKSYIQQLNTDANLLKMCIASLPPKAADKSEEDETVKAALNDDIYQTCYELMEMIADYYKNRAECVIMAANHHQGHFNLDPEELRKSVISMDEDMCLSMRSAVGEIRNHYRVLHGLLAKHFDSAADQSDHE